MLVEQRLRGRDHGVRLAHLAHDTNDACAREFVRIIRLSQGARLSLFLIERVAIIGLLTFAIMNTVTAHAAPRQLDEKLMTQIDQAIQEAIDAHATPGAVVLIGDKTDTLYTKAY